MLLRMVCWQKVVFPDPGGPTSRITFLDGTSWSWLNETNINPNNKKENTGLFNVYSDETKHARGLRLLDEATCPEVSMSHLRLPSDRHGLASPCARARVEKNPHRHQIGYYVCLLKSPALSYSRTSKCLRAILKTFSFRVSASLRTFCSSHFWKNLEYTSTD